ncbi:hypothetical protein HCN44_010196 [Aphidius gifuensis]|uniref:Glutamyl-tRNA(Gln) amidotransferase subunit A, mitochondrial n=1 Tax=Aphidius gifuensis TaxID=684658 RepID=A0A834XZA3_APHGI|nr:glutamyl-tRNA(Gln) amidotransferase subunit A, mitochondrial [Aphidius gifuensis]KAF7993601.1 hypothetical protein HCN44_010196 [Aphidius gifuensis]
MNKILSSSIKNVSKKIHNAELKPSELYNASLNLINNIKPLNAYINVTDKIGNDQSNESNKRQNDGKLLGELDGILIAIKDNFCVENVPTTCASLMLENFIPGYNATVYKKLRDNGAVLMGKTNLDEFAMGSGTVDSHFGPTKNIWGSKLLDNYTIEKSDLSTSNIDCSDNWHIAGGSSGGSAIAVVTGTCFAALGSDTGGSTRNPASYCGLVGYKPTYGLVSRHGLIPLVNSMDVPGILTRNINDCIEILNAIAGPDDYDSTTINKKFNPIELTDSIDVSGLRVGIPKEYNLLELNDEVKNTWNNVANILTEAGAIVSEISMPHTDLSAVCYSVLNQCEVASNMSRYDGIEYGLRANENTSTEKLYAKSRSMGFNDVVRSRILTGNYYLLQENYNDYFLKAMKIRRLISNDFNDIWNNCVDVILTPTTLTDAPLYKDFISKDNQTQCSQQDYCTQPANLAGIPAISIPICHSSRGMPLSLQLMTPFLHDKQLFNIAKWIENAVQYPKLVLNNTKLIE